MKKVSFTLSISLPPPLSLKLTDFPENTAGSLLLQKVVFESQRSCGFKASYCNTNDQSIPLLCLTGRHYAAPFRSEDGWATRKLSCLRKQKESLVKELLFKEAKIRAFQGTGQAEKRPNIKQPASMEQRHFLSCRREVIRQFDLILKANQTERMVLPTKKEIKEAFLNRSRYLNMKEADAQILAFLRLEQVHPLSLAFQEAIAELIAPDVKPPASCRRYLSTFYRQSGISLLLFKFAKTLAEGVHVRQMREPLFFLLACGFLVVHILSLSGRKRSRSHHLDLRSLSVMELFSLLKNKALFFSAPKWNKHTLSALLQLAALLRDNLGRVLIVEVGHNAIGRPNHWWSPFSLADFLSGKAEKDLLVNKIKNPVEEGGQLKNYFYRIDHGVFFLRSGMTEYTKLHPEMLFGSFGFSCFLLALPPSRDFNLPLWQKQADPLIWIQNEQWLKIHGK